jgi:hypothetical protein
MADKNYVRVPKFSKSPARVEDKKKSLLKKSAFRAQYKKREF